MVKKYIFFLSLLTIAMLFFCSAYTAYATSEDSFDEWSQAIELQIADGQFLARAQEPCSQKDVVRLIANVHNMQYDRPSRFLTDMLQVAKAKPASRFWLAQAIFYSAQEMYFEEPYESYQTWMDYCDSRNPEYGWPDAGLIGVNLRDQTIGEYGVWELCPDISDVEDPANKSNVYYRQDYGNPCVANYSMLLFDRTNGAKILKLDEDGRFLPQKVLTVNDAVQAAVRFYRSFEAKPKMLPYGEINGYDSSIITDELLGKESTLPEATCQQLPEQWHGVLTPSALRSPERS